jgi:hypothetical protein
MKSYLEPVSAIQGLDVRCKIVSELLNGDMTMAALEQEIIERLSKLNTEDQKRVLEFVRNLAQPQGIPGESLIARAHEVNFDPADLEEMSRAIEEGCERIESEGNSDLFA